MAKYIASTIGLVLLIVLQLFQACKLDDNTVQGELDARDVTLALSASSTGAMPVFYEGESVAFKFELAEPLPVQTIVDWYIVPDSVNLQADPNTALDVSAGSLTIEAESTVANLVIQIKIGSVPYGGQSFSLRVHRLSGYVNMTENFLDFSLAPAGGTP